MEAIEDSGQTPAFFLDRHSAWRLGRSLDKDDAALNDQALVNGERLLSAYRTLKNVRLWIITEAVDDDGKRDLLNDYLPQ